MKMKMFTVYDCKAETYNKPFCVNAKGEALRGFMDIAHDKETAIGQHPEDFTLFEIGEFDTEDGLLKAIETKVALACAIDLIKEQKIDNKKLEIAK